MNWQHLIYFKTVAELQNYSKAGDKLYITPSALSKAIHNLEVELNIPLFQKVGRNLSLTSYGEEFYECVSNVSDTIEDCVNAIHSKMGVVNGRVRVGGNYTMCAEYLPTKIKAFKSVYPDVEIDLRYYTTDSILQGVLDGSIDIGFCGDFDSETKAFRNLDRIFLRSDELIVMVSEEHPLAQRNTVDFCELQDENFIIHKASNMGTNFAFRKLCARYHLVPNIAFEVPDDQSILGLVKNNLGVAVIANNPVLRREGIRTLHIREKDPIVRNNYMVWRKDAALSPVAKAFQAQILDT